MPGGNWFSGFHQLIVQPCLIDDLAWMPHELPDPVEDHCLLCVVLSDLPTLQTQLQSHGCHLCILRPDLVELLLRLVQFLLVRPLCQLPENVSGSAATQRLAGPFGDVLQPVVLGLEILQFVMDACEANSTTLKHPSLGDGFGDHMCDITT
jgi:hypothetical protein